MLHVYPLDDLRPHDTASTQCACGPRVEWDHAEALVIHHSFDGRELWEPDRLPATEPDEA